MGRPFFCRHHEHQQYSRQGAAEQLLLKRRAPRGRGCAGVGRQWRRSTPPTRNASTPGTVTERRGLTGIFVTEPRRPSQRTNNSPPRAPDTLTTLMSGGPTRGRAALPVGSPGLAEAGRTSRWDWD